MLSVCVYCYFSFVFFVVKCIGVVVCMVLVVLINNLNFDFVVFNCEGVVKEIFMMDKDVFEVLGLNFDVSVVEVVVVIDKLKDVEVIVFNCVKMLSFDEFVFCKDYDCVFS